MKTIIFDIDGTLTDMGPIENAAFLKFKKLPKPRGYPLVNWIKLNNKKYNFVYATGGQKLETEYALKCLGILKYFDTQNSISKTNYLFSKKTGLPFKKIKIIYSDCILITDSKKDCMGAALAKIPFILVKPGERSISQRLLSRQQ